MVKLLSTMQETWVWSLGREVPWRRKRQPTPVLLPRKSHGWRSLVSVGSQRARYDWGTSLHFHFKNKELTRRIAWSFPGSSVVKNPPANAGDVGSIPGSEDPLEENMATHSSVLAWEIPWTEDPGGEQTIGSQRVGLDWVTEHTHMQKCNLDTEKTLSDFY